MPASSIPRRRPIDGLREWAARTPDSVALCDDDTTTTFAQLLGHVEDTAPALRAVLHDGRPDAYLPVLVDRSAASAVAVLTCLLGRVRFVPIAADAPDAFKQLLHQRTGGARHYLAGPPDACLPGADPIAPSDLTAVGSSEPPDEDPALVVFSSGSTGAPKGIVSTWHVLDSWWRSRDAGNDAFGFDTARRQPVVLPLDSAWCMTKLTDVASGFGEDIIDVTRWRPAELLGRLARFEPTAMATPVQLARLLAELPDHAITPLPSVRRLHIASEGLHYEQIVGLRRIFDPQTVLVHSLASSEAGRELIFHSRLGETPQSGQVPLGRPLFPDCVRFARVPGMDAEVTEVHVAGAIATGYLDDPELTADRFYRDPDGSRWWRSSDLVSVDVNGDYRHHGRMDDLVKVGSKLVAPSGVTAAICRVRGVRAAVTLPETTNGRTRLVAHVETDPGSPLTLAELRAALAAHLPAYAVPTAMFRHARLPVNERGKIDRTSLADGPFEPW